jgi:hypothetical protein
VGIYSIEHLSKMKTSDLLKKLNRYSVICIYKLVKERFDIELIDDANIMENNITRVESDEPRSFMDDYLNNVSIEVLNLPSQINMRLCAAGIDNIAMLTKMALRLSVYIDEDQLQIIRDNIFERYGGHLNIG